MTGRIGTTRTQVLDAIRIFVTLNRYPPSFREITAFVGAKSPSHINYHLQILRAAGAINYQDDTARSIVVLEGCCTHCGGSGLAP